MPPVKHALLGASSAEKWLHCTPSARMEEKMPDRAGTAAAEGSLAHELAELKVRKHFEPMSKTTYTRRLNKLKAQELWQDEMDRHTETYMDYLKDAAAQYDTKPYVAVEVTELDYSYYAPEGFGTADCIMIGGKLLRIVDFKYGKGVAVSAEDNAQMKLYALAALLRYGMLYDIRKAVLTIVQPRRDTISEWHITADALREWGETVVKPAAKLAFAGEGECCAGPWCDDYFCKCRARCAAYVGQIKQLDAAATVVNDPNLLTDSEIGTALTIAAGIRKWYGVLEEYALESVLEGRSIPGWKAVEGRSNRQFDDQDAVFKELVAAGIDEALLYERRPITLTAVEKLLGKEFTPLVGGHVVKPMGKPTLVPEKDPRAPYSRAAADFASITKNK